MSGEGMEMDATTRAMPRQGWVSGLSLAHDMSG
jgi:hypothetical protein